MDENESLGTNDVIATTQFTTQVMTCNQDTLAYLNIILFAIKIRRDNKKAIEIIQKDINYIGKHV